LNLVAIVAIGFAVGLLLGLTGMGSGSLLTPLLIMAAGFSPATAVGTSLVFAFATKIYGSWRFYRKGLVRLKIIRELLTGALPGLILGFLLLLRLRSSSPQLMNVFVLRAIGVALIGVFLLMVARLLPFPREGMLADRLPTLAGWQERALTPLVGFGVGLSVTLTSIGAGVALIPALYLRYRLDSGTLVGTSIFLGTLLAAGAGILHAAAGNVDWRVMGALLCGSIPAVWLASHMHGRLPRRISEGIIAVAILALGVRFLVL
jgi:uncharacterized membrane protein YfcA